MQENISILDEFYQAIDESLGHLFERVGEESLHLQKYTLSKEATLSEILKFFEKDNCDSLVIVEKDRPVGIITEQDLLRKIPLPFRAGEGKSWDEAVDPFSLSAADIMTSNPNTVGTHESVKSAMLLMSLRKFRHVPVIDESGHYQFTLDLKTLFNFILPIFKDYVNDELVVDEWDFITVDEYDSILPNDFSFDEFSSHMELFFKAHMKRLIYHRPLVLDVSSHVGDAIELLGHRGRSALLVTQYETQMLGILTERDLMRKFFIHPELISKARELSLVDFMTENPHMLLSKHSLGNALSNINRYHYRNIILVDEDKMPLSIIELMDIFKFILFHLVKRQQD